MGESRHVAVGQPTAAPMRHVFHVSTMEQEDDGVVGESGKHHLSMHGAEREWGQLLKCDSIPPPRPIFTYH